MARQSSLPERTCPYSQPECRWRLSGVHACRNAGFSLLLTPGSKKYRVLHAIGSDQPAPVDRHQSPARQPHRGHRRPASHTADIAGLPSGLATPSNSAASGSGLSRCRAWKIAEVRCGRIVVRLRPPLPEPPGIDGGAQAAGGWESWQHRGSSRAGSGSVQSGWSSTWSRRPAACRRPAVGSGSSASSWKIIPGGSSGGRMPPVRASWGQRLLAAASVRAGQALYGRYSDALVVHGKEKVYGSIP